MEDKNEQILSQYDLVIKNTYKLRGSVMLECEDGLRIMKNYDYSERKAETENIVKLALMDTGYQNTDIIEKNKEGKYLSQNRYGNTFVVKRWYKGEECNLCENDDIVRATVNLAMLHNSFRKINLCEEEHCRMAVKNVSEEYQNYNNEIKRVKKYIHNKKKKNELEVVILNNIDKYYCQGCEAEAILEQMQYNKLFCECSEKNAIYHGAYNQHNIILCQEDTATVNFNQSGIGPQIFDLYSFIRKTLEKNSWNIEFADLIINEYDKHIGIDKNELSLLYVLFYYPEKFRKLINSYYNSQKVWVSGRIINKLNSVISNEPNRDRFIQYLQKRVIL